jgi:transposase InsO family protein
MRTRRRTRQVSQLAVACAEELVRRLHGLIGADALCHSIFGLSRRVAQSIKVRTLSAMERERKAALTRLTITQPGIMRGFDALHIATANGPLYALIGADATVPYRTSVTAVPRYDAEAGKRALTADLERNGAPLVLRLDRAKAHSAPAVRALLEAQGVLILQGPPRYPRFYGQLERQNREHRGFLTTCSLQRRVEAEACLHEMLHCVNDLWRRRALHWQTATEVWNARPRLTVDRNAFREEVQERARKIAHELKRRAQPATLAERLGIEQTLERMGYLRQEIGGWC